MKRLLLLLALLPFAVNAQVVTPPNAVAMVCANNTVVPTPTDGKFFYVQCDSSGRLITNGGSASGSIPATGNITEYVATTGSDTGAYANCQAVAHPCATIQHAVNVATLYNYVGLYALTINVADATYAVNGVQPAVTLLPLVNYPVSLNPTLNGNTSTPANVVISNTSGDAVTTGNQAYWNIQGFRLKSTSGTNADLYAQNRGSITITGPMDFAGSGILMQAIKAIIYAPNQSINVSSTVFTNLAKANDGYIIPDSATITFPVGGCTVSDYVVSLVDQSVFGFPTFVNGSGVVGNKFSISNESYIENSISRTSFPGNGSVHIQGYSWYSGDNGLTLYDPAGTLWADGNVTNANGFTVHKNLIITGTEFDVDASALGGHYVSLHESDGAGELGLIAGQGAFIDYTTGNMLWWWNASAGVTFPGVVGFSTQGSYSAVAPGAGFSLLGAASLALGNGTASDFTGTLKLSTLNPVTSYQLNGVLMVSATAPTISAGFCATTPSISASNGVAAFDINVGTSCSGSVGTLAMPTATTGWVCNFANVTAPASNVVSQTGGANNTVTLTNYARTTGSASNFTASNHIRASCVGY